MLEFSYNCPRVTVKALEDKGFDNLTAHDLDGLKIKKGHIAVIREAAKTLQIKHGESPLQTQVTTDREDMAGPNLVRLLKTLAITAKAVQAQQRTTGGCHQIIDFVSSPLLVEEEVAHVLRGRLKLSLKPDRVSPAMLIPPNS